MKISKIIFFIFIAYYLIFGIMDYFLVSPNKLIQIVDSLVFVFLFAFLLKSPNKIRYDTITIIFLLLLTTIIVSFMVNWPELFFALAMARQYLICGLFYEVLILAKFPKTYYKKLIKYLYLFAYVQLPITIIQKILFHHVPLKYHGGLLIVDWVCGTFGKGNSGVLGCFLGLMIIMKLQECFIKKFSMKRICQLMILITPLALIQSDAQYLFLGIIFIYILFANIKNMKLITIIKYGVVLFIAIYSVNFILLKTTTGYSLYTRVKLRFDRKYIEKINKRSKNTQYILSGHGLRLDEMFYFMNKEISILGDGPGSWYKSAERNKKDGKVMRLNSTVLVNYAELGLLGVLVVFLIPVYTYLNSSKNHWAVIVKAQSIFMLMLLFYHLPFYRFQLAMPFFITWQYYKNGYYKKISNNVSSDEIHT